MTVLFTEEEREWIDRVDFNWRIDPDCPESLVGPIKAKLALLYGQEETPQDATEAENYNHDNSAQPLDNSVNSGRMNTDNPPQTDGGPGSGNHGHKGVPGQRGGSAPSKNTESSGGKKNVEKEAGESASISARGANAPCTGFASEALYKRHVKRHLSEYPEMTGPEYRQHAIDFLTMPCSETIDGYRTKEGEIVRFDRADGEYAKGIPGGRLITCYIARFNKKEGVANLEAANRYFDRLKEQEGVNEDGQ